MSRKYSNLPNKGFERTQYVFIEIRPPTIKLQVNISNIKTMSSSILFRICAASAIIAGILRAITSFIPESIPNVLLIYLAVDLCLLVGVIGLYGFFVSAPKLIPLLGCALMILALVVLIGRDLGLASANIYAGAAETFSL